MEWQPIETCPVFDDEDEERQGRWLMLWVERGGNRGDGCPSFGRKYPSGNIRAAGFHGDWKFTHWCFVERPK